MQPLDGVTVLDATRMVPGAVAARMLIELGARLIKLEDPGSGDPLRHAPPIDQETGIGFGFTAFYRGAESLCLNLREEGGAARLRTIARHADVFLESFRTGTTTAWGIGYDRLSAANPGLVYCSISGFGRTGKDAARVGHDLNFTAASGILMLSGEGRLPRVPFSDVSGGMLAATSIVAALLGRVRTGRGCAIDQPLARALDPFLAWARAEAEGGGGGFSEELLAGQFPAYHVYKCADGKRVALCALEPKFWTTFVDLVELPDLAGLGLERGPAAEDAVLQIEVVLKKWPRSHWLDLAAAHDLPLTAVEDVAHPTRELNANHPATFLSSLGRPSSAPPPKLGEHTARILREFGAVE